MQKPLKTTLEEGTHLLLDGAMGTELYSRGIFINRCYDETNLASPDVVTQIHRDYITSGANIITTNSWGANRFKLKQFNLDDKLEQINKSAAELALRAAENQAYVLGSIGPLGVRIEPWGPTSFAEAKETFKEQIKILVDAGVHGISLETFGDLSEMQQALLAAKEVCKDTPVFAHLMVDERGKLVGGASLPHAFKQLIEWGADVIGLNCSVGPAPMLSAIEKLKHTPSKPICVQPNAGLPRTVEGRKIYMCSPEYMAEFAKNFMQAGVQIVGGCCGTTPEHIKTMANALRHHSALSSGGKMFSPTSIELKEPQKEDSAPEVTRIAAKDKSNWARKIANGEPVYAVELLPPAGVVPDKILERSAELKAAGVDVVNIPDGPRASARMSAILTAVLIEQKIGIETVLHYTCRDRNLVGMQSDILGAHAIGLRNLLLVTGDPPKIGSYPDATGVFDIDAIGLTNMVHRLNGGVDLAGRCIGEPTSISIGVGANPVHQNLEYEFGRFKHKVEAGAEWTITQPVFDCEALFRFMDWCEKRQLSIPVIAGIWPLVSLRNALFMNNEVPGVVIPKPLIEAMSKAKDKEDAVNIGIDIAMQMIDKLGNSVQGIQMSAPFGRIELALRALGKSSQLLL